jgi:hypothetical protein
MLGLARAARCCALITSHHPLKRGAVEADLARGLERSPGLMIRETRGCVVDPIALLFVVGVGFALGYGVREWKSRKRRRRYTYLRETADEAPRVTS